MGKQGRPVDNNGWDRFWPEQRNCQPQEETYRAKNRIENELNNRKKEKLDDMLSAARTENIMADCKELLLWVL